MNIQRNDVRVAEDNFALNRLGFTTANWRLFFGRVPKMSEGAFELPITPRFLNLKFKPEILFLDGRRRIPSQTYFEFKAYGMIGVPNTVYVFQSTTDALAFFQIRSLNNTNSMFVVVGKNPHEEVLKYVKESFKNSKFILCFPNNMMAKVSEIKIAGFLVGVELKLTLENSKLLCDYRSKMVQIPVDVISLSKVSKLSGFYPKKVRTLKPKSGFESFYDLIRSL